MKRLACLLAVCLSFAARAQHVRTSPIYGMDVLPYSASARPKDLWQRNNGIWEKVVRVNKESAYYDFFDFRAVTNGVITRTFPHSEVTNILWRVDYDHYTKYSGNSTGNERKNYSWHVYGFERVHPIPAPMAWTNDINSITFKTNKFTEECISHNWNVRYDYTAFTPVRTNVLDVTPQPISYFSELPCRFGVPQSIVVNPPYTDLMEQLPLDYPETYVRIRTGFDGYLLIRFEEDEMRLTIKRLLPEKLPYEHPRRNIRVLRDDLLNGV